MIELNIIRESLAKFKRKRVIINLFIIYFGGLAFILLALSMNYFGNRIEVSRISHDIGIIKKKMEKESAVISLMKKKSRDTEDLLDRMSFFISQAENRILWTNKIGFISRSLPSGVWLSRISSSRPMTDNDPRQLEIEGYILHGTANERLLIDRFIRNLGSGGYFEKVKLAEISRNPKEKREAVFFKVSCDIFKKDGQSAKLPD